MLYRTESAFRLALKKHLETHGWQAQIIEVGSINRGVPDLYVCKNGSEHWVELKNSNSQFGASWHIDFRPGQQAWLRRNYSKGGKPIVIEAGHNKYAIHKFTSVIKDNVLYSDFELVYGLERLAYLMESYLNAL